MTKLPDLHPPVSRTLALTTEILRQETIARALFREMARFAKTYRSCPDEAVFVRIAFEGGHLEGWYRPADQEFEPVGISSLAATA